MLLNSRTRAWMVWLFILFDCWVYYLWVQPPDRYRDNNPAIKPSKLLFYCFRLRRILPFKINNYVEYKHPLARSLNCNYLLFIGSYLFWTFRGKESEMEKIVEIHFDTGHHSYAFHTIWKSNCVRCPWFGDSSCDLYSRCNVTQERH